MLSVLYLDYFSIILSIKQSYQQYKQKAFQLLFSIRKQAKNKEKKQMFGYIQEVKAIKNINGNCSMSGDTV